VLGRTESFVADESYSL